MDVKLTIAKGGSKGKSLQLRSAQTIVGRAAGSDIRIPSAAVSRRHCRLIVHNGYVVVEDLGSANGTFVNGARVRRQAIRPGDRLEIGPLLCIVKYHLTETALERMLRDEDSEPLVEVEAAESSLPEVDVVDVEAMDAEPMGFEAVETEAVEDEPLEPVMEIGTAEVNVDNVTTEEPEVPRGTKKKTVTKKKTTAPPKKKDEKKKDQEREASPDQQDTAAWETGPGGDDIRDILSQLE